MVVDPTGQPITELAFGDTTPQLLRITNDGTAPSGTLSLGITGDAVDDFTVDPFTTCDHHVLGKGDTCDVVIDYRPQTSEPRTATLTIADASGSSISIALRPPSPPGLRIVLAGGGVGEVAVSDPATGLVLATCTAACTVRANKGQMLSVTASTPSIFGGLSGACSTPEAFCDVTIGATTATVTATFATDPKEQWTRLPGGGSILSAAFDSSGNLVVASKGVVKLSPAGAVIWQIPLTVCVVATGPGDTIYAQTATQVVKLGSDGAMLWSSPLDPHAVGCGGTEGFVHNLAVGSDGAVAIHGDTGVARWDASGKLSWAAAVDAHGEYGVAIDPAGVVDVAVLSTVTGETVDLARFAADGTPLAGQERIANQYHGMFVVDATGRLLATGSGHSHTDALGHSIDLLDPDYAPNGICAAGTDAAWLYQADDESSLARDWTVNRYHTDGSLAWTYHLPLLHDGFFGELGTIPLDIAGAPDGRIAIVGSFTGPTYFGGWIATFAP